MTTTPLACVMGDIDLLRPLGLEGIPCVVVAPPGAPTRYSRFAGTILEQHDAWQEPEALLDVLMTFGRRQYAPPVLYYEEDGQLLFVSRHRDRLSPAFRFVLPDAALAEDLVDKVRFFGLASRLGLPVPRTVHLRPGEAPAGADLGLRFPLIVKPPVRRASAWTRLGVAGKAFRVADAAAFRVLRERLDAVGAEALVQEEVVGPETAVESYHVYVDAGGDVAAEFTGRKVRTWPLEFGHSTALEISDARDVRALGRELTAALGLTGVAKFDFKRAPDGRLFLLEVNPRFNLWHYPGALAGANIPALVYRDLTDGAARRSRPAPVSGRPGIRWTKPWTDLTAARASGVPFARWLRWTLGAEAKRGLAWDDPLAILGPAAWAVRRRLTGAHRSSSPPAPPAGPSGGNGARPKAPGNGNGSNGAHPLRVLMVTTEWPRETWGGTPTFIARQAAFLRAAGVDVDVFEFRGGKHVLNYARAWLSVHRRIRRAAYDLVHAQFGQSALVALPTRLPLVVTFRGDDVLGVLDDHRVRVTAAGRVLQVLSKFVARAADAAIVVSEHMKAYLGARVRAHVIPSGLDFELFRPVPQLEARRRLGLPENRNLVLFVGDPGLARKRFDLARAAVDLVNESLPAELIVGWGVPHERIALLMNACDVLVFTSAQEGSPNVVKEALACDLPVVSVDVGDVAERLRGVAGCVLCADDAPHTIARAVEQVLRVGRRVRGREAVRALDEHRTTERVLGVYRSVLGRGRPVEV